MTTARLYSNGLEIRVDMENTKERWPNCRNEHKGFPFLTFGFAALIKATEYALNNGATRVLYNDNELLTVQLFSKATHNDNI